MSHRYEVDAPYVPGRTRWAEGVDFNFRNGELELRLFLGRLRPPEIEAIRRGTPEFALYVEETVILFLYRFGKAIPWSDAPFSWWLVPEEERSLPPAIHGPERALLQVILIDADTGLIRALRAVTLSPSLTLALYQAIARQATAAAWDQATFDRVLARLYRENDSQSLARRGVR